MLDKKEMSKILISTPIFMLEVRRVGNFGCF